MKQEIIKLRLEGKTYNEICKIVKCSKSIVSYYCKDLDINDDLKKSLIIDKNQNQQKDIDSEIISKIKNLIDLSKSRRFISKEIGLSLYLVDKICRVNGFNYSSVKNVTRDEIVSMGLSGKSISNISKSTGISRLTVSNILNGLGIITTKIKKNQSDYIKKWRSRTKQKLIDYKGGSCSRCGYDRCNKALQFHHLDPKEKDFNISSGYLSFDLLLKEVDKCILVCANCHVEIHEEIMNS